MKTVPPLSALLLVVSLAACGSDEGGTPAHSPAPPPAPVPAAPAPTAAPSTESTRIGSHVDRAAAHAARQEAETRERSRQVRDALRAARSASRGDQHAEALPHFERALALAPSDERLLCETGYVAYRAGNLERAADLVSKALDRFGNPQQVAEATRVPFAMCLYNAGLVAEARAQTDDARDYFRTSLMLRENRVVRARYDAAGGQSATAAAPPPAVATLPALLARIRASRCTEDDPAEENPYPCTVEVDRQVNASSADFRGAALIRVVTGDYNSEAYLELAVQGRDGWRAAGTVLYVYNPGMNGITEEGEVGAMQFTSLIPDAPEELRFEVTHSRTDTDLGLDEAEFANDAATVLCGLVAGAIRCARVPREHEYVREAMGMTDDQEDVDHANLPIRERYAVALSFQPDAGTLTVGATEGELPAQLRRSEGTRPVREILTSPDFALRVDF